MPAPPIVPQRPLVNFNADIFERGSLLSNNNNNNNDSQQEQEVNMHPPPRGSSASHRKPVHGQNERFTGAFPTDEEEKRRFDEIREMERIQRSLGKPLIDVVAEKKSSTK